MAEAIKIIYIDQDERHRRKAQKAFAIDGYQCTFLRRGEEGLKRIARENPDVVVVDYFLPDMTGEEVYSRYLMEISPDRPGDIPFIVLTTNGKVEKSRLYRLGFSACLGKPFGPGRLLEFVEDVLLSHELKREEAHFWDTMREAKDFLEKVVESTVDFIVTTDNKGIITYCNRACEDMLGCRFEEIVGRRVSDFLRDATSEMMRISAIMRKRKKLENYRTELVDSGGKEVPVNLSISSMRNDEGRIMGALAVGNPLHGVDFTEFDSQASDRLAAIIETAVAVNHEINNPLVPILGNAQFLLQDESVVDEEVRRRLRSIVHNALRIRDITQKLANIRHPVTKEYLRGTRMLDIQAST
jgi:PAS domain S-box-containing protein